MTYPLWLDPDERVSRTFEAVGVPASFLQPRSTWPDGASYDRQAAALARMFADN